MREILVEIQSDHLAAQSRVARPLDAIAELVWNGVDADATEVRVAFQDALAGDALELIRVVDNGTGMRPIIAEQVFKNLGGSWKTTKALSDRKRALHGVLPVLRRNLAHIDVARSLRHDGVCDEMIGSSAL